MVEYVGGSDLDDGLVVRRSWLSEEPGEGKTNWDGLIRVEHLLVRPVFIFNSDLPVLTITVPSNERPEDDLWPSRGFSLHLGLCAHRINQEWPATTMGDGRTRSRRFRDWQISCTAQLCRVSETNRGVSDQLCDLLCGVL